MAAFSHLTDRTQPHRGLVRELPGEVSRGNVEGFAPDKLRRSKAVLSLVEAFNADSKPIAFICHAGWVPISAGIGKGRRATSVDAIRDDMVNAGPGWVDEACVVDGNLISARTPADLGPWMKALLTALSAE